MSEGMNGQGGPGGEGEHDDSESCPPNPPKVPPVWQQRTFPPSPFFGQFSGKEVLARAVEVRDWLSTCSSSWVLEVNPK